MTRYTIPKNDRGLWPARGRILPALRGIEAFRHPDVVGWRRWILREWRPTSTTVLVTPCSNVKPYPRSPVSGKVRGVLRRLGLWDSGGRGLYGSPRGIDWVYLSDLLGLVPYDMAHEYPACCYDLPPDEVLAHPWARGELVRFLAQALETMARRGVDLLISYLPSKHRAILRDAAEAAATTPRIVHVRYNIFHGHRNLEEAIKIELRISQIAGGGQS